MRRDEKGHVRPEYWIWRDIKQRCQNPRSTAFRNYGGRGITVCSKWQSFSEFFGDMGKRPTPRHTIERIDNDKGYEPGNCVWVPPGIQQTNTRQCVRVTFKGKTQCVAVWCRELGLVYRRVLQRIVKLGWKAEKAFTAPKQGERHAHF